MTGNQLSVVFTQRFKNQQVEFYEKHTIITEIEILIINSFGFIVKLIKWMH
jgi:hypothetical protein